MTFNLVVLADHNLNFSKSFELENKVKNRLSNFSLINKEHLREIALLQHAENFENVNENEIIEEKIYKMSISTDYKVKFEKEFTEEQHNRILEKALKEYTRDEIINNEKFECNYLYVGDKVVDNFVHVSGGMGFSFDVVCNMIDFRGPIVYKDWLHLHKFVRDEWRKYFLQIIKLFGGTKAIYIPCYIFDLINEYIEEIDTVDIYKMEEYLKEIFGKNDKKIYRILENEYCGYVIDDFSDINLDKNIDIKDFKLFLKNI